MKIRYPVTALVLIIITLTAMQTILLDTIPYRIYDFAINLLGILSLICICLIVYLIIRNIFRAIKGATTGVPQGASYRDKARRACEKVTPKKRKDTTPPWEG